MFGYVVVNRQELKIRELDLYKSYYCGLCRELKERFGIAGQISLNYDVTFALLFLSALYEPPVQRGTTRCAVHPVMKQTVRRNEITAYAADMNILLSYYKCMDDWTDEKKLMKRGYAATLQTAVNRLEKQYPGKSAKIRKSLKTLSDYEKQGVTDIDVMAGCSGRLLEEIFVYRKDNWESSLRSFGFYLGKFIYILDAYDDLEKDRSSGCYNPFMNSCDDMDALDEKVKGLLLMMMSEACREFEVLPIIRYESILRNILYSGVWSRYQSIRDRRRKEQEK